MTAVIDTLALGGLREKLKIQKKSCIYIALRSKSAGSELSNLFWAYFCSGSVLSVEISGLLLVSHPINVLIQQSISCIFS
jgi:hypothetical protein